MPWALVALLAAIFTCSSCKNENSGQPAGTGANAYQLITGDDIDSEREQWDRTYQKTATYDEEPNPVVKRNLRLFPRGKALVLAMGEGKNAIFLAKNGFDVTGIDFSNEAIRKAKKLAREQNVKIQVVNADLNTYNIDPEAYDLIVAIEFYRPRLINEIRKGLKHGGAVLWESHTTEQTSNVPDRAIRLEHLLSPGQLGRAFQGFKVLISRETNDGKRAVASLLAIKP